MRLTRKHEIGKRPDVQFFPIQTDLVTAWRPFAVRMALGEGFKAWL